MESGISVPIPSISSILTNLNRSFPAPMIPSANIPPTPRMLYDARSTMERCMRKFLAFFLLIAAIFFQFSCNKTEEKQKTTVQKQHTDPYPLPEDAMTANISGEYGGRVVEAILADIKTFNQLLFHEVDSMTMNQLMSPGLTRLNNKTQE